MKPLESPFTPWLRRWLTLCAVLVFAMVVLGGLTRLTESGLSIVEWKLVSGILPPLDGAAWEREFEAYRTSPQYRDVNHGMSLGDFQRIFWLEYLHRLLGRVVGLVFLVPLLVLIATRGSPGWLRRRMALATLLVGVQGTIGWLMVQSGLKDVPWVSPYRLALHLSLAVGLFGLLLVTRMRLVSVKGAYAPPPPAAMARPLSTLALAALSVQIVLGALVAGLDAGLTYNTFPLMDGAFFPDGAWMLSPWPLNLTENIPMVQFLHRWWAFLTAGLIVGLAVVIWARGSDRLKLLALGAAMTVAMQIGLGIATLVHAVPVLLGTLHQAVAVALFGWSICLAYAIRLASRHAVFPHGKHLGQTPLGIDSVTP